MTASPQLLGPLGGAVDPALGVTTFRWTPVPTASEYQLQLTVRFSEPVLGAVAPDRRSVALTPPAAARTGAGHVVRLTPPPATVPATP